MYRCSLLYLRLGCSPGISQITNCPWRSNGPVGKNLKQQPLTVHLVSGPVFVTLVSFTTILKMIQLEQKTTTKSPRTVSLCTGFPLNMYLTPCLFPDLESLIRNNLYYPRYCFSVCSCSFPWKWLSRGRRKLSAPWWRIHEDKTINGGKLGHRFR